MRMVMGMVGLMLIVVKWVGGIEATFDNIHSTSYRTSFC